MGANSIMTTPSDIIRQAINYELRGVNSCIPASIVSYDYTKQQATVQPLLKARYKNGTTQGDIQSLPKITNVPVIFPKGGTFHMHWPLSVGDSVLLVFSQRSLDNWLVDGNEEAPQDPRMFDFSDAIAIPGLIPFSPASPAEDNENFVIQMGSAKMKLDPSGKFCFHGLTEELMSILDELFTLISSITTLAVAVPGNPAVFIPISNASAFTALQTRFNTLKGDCS